MNGTQSETVSPPPKPTFWADAQDCWNRLPNKTFFFVLLAAWLLLFQFLGNSLLGYIHSPSLFSWLDEAYNSPNPAADDGHGDLIPFIVIGLFWWKRKKLLALPLNLWWPGLLILAAAILMHALGYLVQQPRLSVAALFTGIYGLTGLAWGRAWLKESFFPFWLFIFSIPLAALLLPLTFPLRLLVTWLTSVVAHLCTIDVVRVGTQLYGPGGAYQYEVAAACSGMRSLVVIFLLATVYGFVTFKSPWKRLGFMALAFPLSVIGNLTRMLCIIFASEFGGQAAGNYVHENWFFSLVPYIPAIVCLLLIGRWLENRPEGKPS